MKKETTMIRFGTNPIAWANDDDQSIGKDIPTQRILQEAGRLIGFDGIENGHRWPQDDPEALRALLADYGMVFVSGWYSTELLTRSVEDEIAAVQGHLAKLKHNDWVTKVCYYPDLNFLITSSLDGTLKIAELGRKGTSPRTLGSFSPVVAKLSICGVRSKSWKRRCP